MAVHAYASGFTWWLYQSEDRRADVLAPGYFDRGADLFRTGDLLMCALADGSGFYVISANDGTRVVAAELAHAAFPLPAPGGAALAAAA